MKKMSKLIVMVLAVVMLLSMAATVSAATITIANLQKNFIEEVGRLDTPGRPMLFGTTEEFLRCFGIESIMELPEFEERSADETELQQTEGDSVDDVQENNEEPMEFEPVVD